MELPTGKIDSIKMDSRALDSGLIDFLKTVDSLKKNKNGNDDCKPLFAKLEKILTEKCLPLCQRIKTATERANSTAALKTKKKRASTDQIKMNKRQRRDEEKSHQEENRTSAEHTNTTAAPKKNKKRALADQNKTKKRQKRDEESHQEENRIIVKVEVPKPLMPFVVGDKKLSNIRRLKKQYGVRVTLRDIRANELKLKGSPNGVEGAKRDILNNLPLEWIYPVEPSFFTMISGQDTWESVVDICCLNRVVSEVKNENELMLTGTEMRCDKAWDEIVMSIMDQCKTSEGVRQVE